MKRILLTQTANILIQMMSDASNIDASLITSKGRPTNIVTCRFLLFMYLNEELGWSTNEIGRVFYHNHSSVIHGVKRANDFLNMPSYKKECELYSDFLELILLHENDN